jgi:hypothetical protein
MVKNTETDRLQQMLDLRPVSNLKQQIKRSLLP